MLLQLLLLDTDSISEASTTVLRVIISATFVFFAFFYFLKRKPGLTIISYSICILVSILSMIISPSNMQYIFSEGRFLFLINIPIFISVTAIYKGEIFLKMLGIVSRLCSLLGVLYLVLWFNGIVTMQEYSMSFGYALLLPTLYYFWKLNIKYILYALVLVVAILILGNRGPLVAMMCYLFLKYFFYGNIKQRAGIILFSLLLMIIISIFIPSLNSQYRSLQLLGEGRFISHDSNRGEIYGMIWNKILASPFWGHGIFGDRPVWSHNIFLELCCDFGLLIGPLLIVGMFGYAYKKMHSISKEDVIYIFVFICTAFVPLLVSSSYLIHMEFPLLLGLIYRINNKQIFQ
jgi:hypothetical protein